MGGCNNVNVDTFLILAFVIGVSGRGVGGWGGGCERSLDLHTYVMLRYCTFLGKIIPDFLADTL